MFEDLITDRTLEDVQNRTAKGHYNATDLNRVEHAVKEISELLTKEAYPVVYQPHKRLMTIDTQDKNTLLLIHSGGLADKSKYKKEITNQGVTISTTESKFGDACLYFNGNSRLLVDNDQTLNFSDKDFTIDWWEYSPTSTNKCRFNTHYSNTYWTGMVWGYNGIGCYIQSTATTNEWDLLNYWPGMDVVQNQWVHRAVVRSGNNIISFKNGKIVLQTTISGAIYHNSDFKFVIGDYITQDRNMFIGYIDEFRVSDIARWTSEFTPKTTRYTSDDNTVMLINAEVSDNSLFSRGLINNGAVEKKITGSINDTAMYFDGSTKITLPLGDWRNFNKTNRFTIEWREFCEGFSGGNPFTLFGVDNSHFLLHYINSKITLYFYINSATGYNGTELTNVIPSVWMHRALSYDGNKLRFFSDGKLVWESDYTESLPYDESYSSAIAGRNDGTEQFFKGYIEEFRISDITRYTENFAPPTKPFEVGEIREEITAADWILPEEYSTPEIIVKDKYIENQDKAYIDTGIVGKGTLKIVFDGCVLGESQLFGARTSLSANMFVILYEAMGRYRIDYNTSKYYADSAKYKAGDRHVFIIDQGKIYIDGELLKTVSASSFNSGYNVYLYYINTAGNINTVTEGVRMYSCQIYDNGTLVRDFEPAENDGLACLYDKVSQTYFYHIGEGSFNYIEETETVGSLAEPDLPTATEMTRYLNNIKEIKRQFYQKKSTPELPREMDRLRHTGANAIEQLIVDTNDRLIDVEKIKRKSGTFKAGELLP